LLVIPAIDLKGGKCVRLVRGDFSRVTVYSENPAEMAGIWRDKGARRIHVVDLDGSLAGSPRNREVISAIVGEAGVPVQVGGGIRDRETVDAYLGMGVGWVILGTAALRDERFVKDACNAHPGRIILGIDASDGRVAVQGWTEATSTTAAELARLYEGYGIAAIVYTDIARDGTETGVNVEGTKNLARSTNIPVIASGGVASIRDIEQLREIEKFGVVGVIAGKSLYTGALSLDEAIRVAAGAKTAGETP
jgi:phosphoribosylformimino-5-aminoimidazole carboxamide ribotide isomerase